MSEQKPQGAETPVIVAEQGQPRADVIVPQTTPAKAETTPTVSNSEWQTMQENLRTLNERLSDKELSEFEQQNPIVTNEKYGQKWADLKKQKKDPNSKYAKLTYDELRKLMVEPETVTPMTAPQSVSVPSIHPSVSPDPAGKTDRDARKWLEMRYSKEQIDATESAA